MSFTGGPGFGEFDNDRERVAIDGAFRSGHERLRAPRGDREVLALPPLESVGALLNVVDRRARCAYDVQGRSLCDLSALARRELLDAARHYTAAYRDLPPEAASDRILLAGHQPQLFHPGVWYKNFALAHLAREHQATALNLVIDSDTLKDASLRVPGGTVDEPAARVIPFDEASGAVPYTRRTIRNRRVFESFGRTAGEWLRPLVAEALLDTYWPKVIARSRETDNLGECLAQARHQVEGEWGSQTLELPQSRVCGFESFHWFVAHLLANLPRFSKVYNDTVLAYRRLHGIRSVNHPVPLLEHDGQWSEAPFWITCDTDAQRRHLFVSRRGGELLLSDRHRTEVAVPLAEESDAGGAVMALNELAARGVQLQTRALTTTLFARLFLGDLFVHGIGGGKYDQLTDELIRRFFDLEPPTFMVLSATLYLPVGSALSEMPALNDIRQRLRELTFHPERYLDLGALSNEDQGKAADLITQKRHWIETAPTVDNARERCRSIRQANEGLETWLEGERSRLLAQSDEAARRARSESVLRWREYAFCLYPEPTLREFFSPLIAPTATALGP